MQQQQEEQLINALIQACYRDDIKTLQNLLKKGANVDTRDNNGWTLLHHATSPEVVEFLIKNGADVNARDNISNSTPLHYASSLGNEKMVRLLIQNGADVNAKNKNGRTPLHMASSKDKDNRKIMGILIENGADIDIKDKLGKTVLSNAIHIKNQRDVEFLNQVLEEKKRLSLISKERLRKRGTLNQYKSHKTQQSQEKSENVSSGGGGGKVKSLTTPQQQTQRAVFQYMTDDANFDVYNQIMGLMRGSAAAGGGRGISQKQRKTSGQGKK